MFKKNKYKQIFSYINISDQLWLLYTDMVTAIIKNKKKNRRNPIF